MNKSDTLTYSLRAEFLKNRNAYMAEGEPVIFHCHHYNTYLQAVIEDTADYLNVYPILSEPAHEISFSQFSSFFSQKGLKVEDRKKIVEDYFRYSGFGKIDLSNVTSSGGNVSTAHDHYGLGWKLKFGKRDANIPGVSFFTLGFIEGALEAIYDLPLGSCHGMQTKCLAKGDPQSEFVFNISEKRKLLSLSVEEGKYQTAELIKPENTNINYSAIRDALSNMPIEGSEETGIVDAFGVYITRMYSNYYCQISYKFLKEFEKEQGQQGLAIARELLTEAGHVCAAFTFGGISQSAEFQGLIKPMIKTKEDWIHGLIAVANSFGWGFWEVLELEPAKRILIKITSGYESNSYLGMYSNCSHPVSFLAIGGIAGLMNLAYNSELPEKPLSIDNNFYLNLHKGNKFVGQQLKCRTMGDEYDLIEAKLG
jgi:hypothetical protein